MFSMGYSWMSKGGAYVAIKGKPALSGLLLVCMSPHIHPSPSWPFEGGSPDRFIRSGSGLFLTKENTAISDSWQVGIG